MEDIVTTIKVNPDSLEKIREIAKQNERSLSAQIRVILEAYLEKRGL